MKIPRPREAERPFRRARPPPIQATKLLFASMSAGVILIVALAIVFIPRALQQEGKPPIPQIVLVVSTAPGWAWVNVSRATIPLPIGDYNATVTRDDGYSITVVGSLPTLNAVDGAVTFRDVNGDGKLNVGDSFAIAIRQPGGTYAIRIWDRPLEKLVGFLEWTA